MSHLVIIDQPAVKECVESNLYQSRQFETGENLANALGGDQTVRSISPRIIPTWKKGCLYFLQSRVETGYLIIDSQVFESIPPETQKGTSLDDRLLVFQRVCRFALKDWNNMGLSFSEMWSPKTGCGVVFPFPKSKQTGFRITLKKPQLERRLTVRLGTKQLFAFTSGLEQHVDSTTEQDRACKKSLEELPSVRMGLESEIKKIQTQQPDTGYRTLVLTDTNHPHIKYQQFDEWLTRLTKAQKGFVTAADKRPQRVEGPAGTGKTLCLLLRSFHLCKTAEASTSEFRVLFVSHSEATKNATAVAFDCLGEPFYHNRGRNQFLQSIELCTLQEWCGRVLGAKEIANSQYLDQDALQAKEMRKLIIKDAVARRIKSDSGSLEYLSSECKAFFESENPDYISELMQHEIGVMIKGRASERLESYLDLPLLAYCLPAKTANDRRFIYSIYKEYQSDLNQSGVFDTDDIVLSTLGRLNTPIWRRRRATEGFDAIVIDETHLFNFNELSVFHHVVRDPQTPCIIFSIDRSQAPGERGITTRLVRELLTESPEEEQQTRTEVVFRSSLAIIKLAEAITSSAATLFTTFENPLVDTSCVMSASDEELAQETIYWRCGNDDKMCMFAISRAKDICNNLKCPASDLLMVVMTESLLPKLRESLRLASRNFIEILHRGDLEAVQRGAKEGAYIVSHPDFVGGLEFKAVLIVGVDEGRVPPAEGAVTNESRHFVEFKACNRLYVALSRARLAAELFYSAERGPSPLLEHARSIGAIAERTAP
jgi:UvrD/REP helicase N-terminal domain